MASKPLPDEELLTDDVPVGEDLRLPSKLLNNLENNPPRLLEDEFVRDDFFVEQSLEDSQQ